MPKTKLEQLILIAEEHDLYILSDEVYRPLFHSISPMDPNFPPSILSMGYPKTIATGSLSKAYALAGIRVGWIASRSREVIEDCAAARDYTTISVSQIDDQVASFALGPDTVHSLLGRNIQLAKTNLDILSKFIDKHGWACEWVKPVAGTTAFVKILNDDEPVDDEDFCKQLLDKTGVMFCPGSKCFGGSKDFKGFVRIGFVQETQTLLEALDQLKVFFKKHLKDVRIAS